uniref:ZP domain-containing protein n=1 Tax=Ciona savignyi TaxID=51511 RepID=H2ZHP9_CIOSA
MVYTSKKAICFLLLTGCMLYAQGNTRSKRGIPGVPFDDAYNSSFGNLSIRHQEPNASVYVSCGILNHIVVNSSYLTSVKVASIGKLGFIDQSGAEISGNCSKNEMNQGYTFKFQKFGDCAFSIAATGDELTVLYKLCVIPSAPAAGVAITRDTSTFFEFTCNYKREVIANLTGIKPNIAKVIGQGTSANGRFSVSIARYTNAQYTTVELSPEVIVLDNVYMQVKLDNTMSDKFIVQMQTCWATPSMNSQDAIKYYIIESGCQSYDPWNPMTNMVTQNYNGTTGKFSFLAFTWKNPPGGMQKIYVHCEVVVCETSTNPAQCTTGPNCTSITSGMNGRRRRSVGGDNKHLVSVGPFHVKSKPCDKEVLGCSHACAVTSQGKPICTCPIGWVLTHDTKTCSQTYAGEDRIMPNPRIVYITEKRARCAGLVVLLIIACLTIIALVTLKPKKLKVTETPSDQKIGF